jgi:3-oxoadipate enol-lactonase
MPRAFLPDLRLNFRDEGDPQGRPVIFAHALGLDLSVWDAVFPLLPPALRLIRFDHRGHGASDVPKAPYSMGALIQDGERLLDHLAIRDGVFVGLSMGGLIAQGLAVKRPDLFRALVLSNTAPRIGHEAFWRGRIDEVAANGLAPGIDATMHRLFSKGFRASDAAADWRRTLLSGSSDGYLGCAAAIAGTDFYTPTAGLTLPTLAIAATEDAITPPDMVRELADLIRGSRFALIRGSGHLPCIEKPAAFAALLAGFLTEIGHI